MQKDRLKLKRCSRCDRIVNMKFFNTDSRNADKVRYECLSCTYKGRLKYYDRKVEELETIIRRDEDERRDKI